MSLKEMRSGSDIRGFAMDPDPGFEINLTKDVARKVGRAFARMIKARAGKAQVRIAVGRDSRLTGEMIKQALEEGLLSEGALVVDTGLSTTPMMFMTTKNADIAADAAVMITASHMPSNRNGIKMFTDEGGLEPSEVDAILEAAETMPLPEGGVYSIEERPDFKAVYAKGLADTVRELTGEEKPLEGAKIVVDAGNGAGGYFVEEVLIPLGADTSGSVFLEPDGSFPNHIPNPENKEAIASIERAVQSSGADLGIIFDTDVDRSAIVDEKGRAINKSAFIAFIAGQVLESYPGSTIVTDSVTSNGLTDFIERRGGHHHRFKRGYKNVIDEAKRINKEGGEAHLAMETSGHGAIEENYFLDDGSYLAVLSLAAFAKARKEGKAVSEYLKDYHYPLEEAEKRFPLKEKDFASLGNDILQAFKDYAEQKEGWTLVDPNYEGVRVNISEEGKNGWILARLSLHEPLLPVNVESEDKGGAEKILSDFEDFLNDFMDKRIES